MTLEEKQKWERIRAQGYDKYLMSSIISKGVPEGLGVTLFTVLIQYLRHEPIGDLFKLFAELVFLVLALGWAHGAINWRKNESEYVKIENPEQNAVDCLVPGAEESNEVR